MNWLRHVVMLIAVAMLPALCAAVTYSQELDPAARSRLEQARASLVIVKLLDQQDKVTSEATGFLIRKDLIATDLELDRNSRVEVTFASTGTSIKVIYPGHYFLPYVLIRTQADISPLSLGDSERVAQNDAVYMLGDAGKIVTGRVTGTTMIKNTRAFSIDLPVNSSNRGAPVFNRYGEVIGIAAQSPDGQGAGLAWPSEMLAGLKHLGEPGVGVGRGDGPRFGESAPPVSPGTPSVTSVDTKPVPLNRPRPNYTEAARANHVEGSVLVRVLVGEDGSVKSVRLVSGLPFGLSEEAMNAARETKFKPAMKDGKPVPFWIGLEISFMLR